MENFTRTRTDGSTHKSVDTRQRNDPQGMKHRLLKAVWNGNEPKNFRFRSSDGLFRRLETLLSAVAESKFYQAILPSASEWEGRSSDNPGDPHKRTAVLSKMFKDELKEVLADIRHIFG